MVPNGLQLGAMRLRLRRGYVTKAFGMVHGSTWPPIAEAASTFQIGSTYAVGSRQALVTPVKAKLACYMLKPWISRIAQVTVAFVAFGNPSGCCCTACASASSLLVGTWLRMQPWEARLQSATFGKSWWRSEDGKDWNRTLWHG